MRRQRCSLPSCGLGSLVAEITERLSGFENTFIKTGVDVEHVLNSMAGSYEVALKGSGSIEADAVIIAPRLRGLPAR